MLIKFETKSARVKGLAFHPQRPWILCSLHNGMVQLWDYRMGALVDQFEGHEGPVRSVAFHPSQPLFVTGGDDYSVRVWNYRTRKCLFVLNGHVDYVRTVAFHAEAPWIVSASDDQTIRIWNWQNRTCIGLLTGHTHYIMSAYFHPKEDLVVSASLDQTVRVWDVSALRRKGSAAVSGETPSSPRDLDLFGSQEASVKFVLEGHDRGVNWAIFHPSKPLIVSGSDDRSIKLWRYNETRAWEIDTFRGHFNNVGAVIFHPRADFLLSVSEDKTIRVWDTSKRGGTAAVYRRDSERFWIICAHPSLNLFAAGHDGGFQVFKLERERPAYCVAENVLYHVALGTLQATPLDNVAQARTICPIERRLVLPATMSFSPAEQTILLSTRLDTPAYDLISIGDRVGSNEVKKGHGCFGVFTARNRFVVLDPIEHQIHIKALDNSNQRSIPCPPEVERLLPSPAGSLLWATKSGVALYDLQQNRVVSEVAVGNVKYAVWSPDGSQVALLRKDAINVVARKTFAITYSATETVAIKSGVWDGNGIFFYTNAHHLKYLLPGGDSGVICTIQQPVYLVRVQGDVVHALDREGALVEINIDPTECLFKLALCSRDYARVTHIINSSHLVGQSIIAYLRNHGYAEIALQFVKDPMTRFELALECADMEAAIEAATVLDRYECWTTLAEEALVQGNPPVAAMAYKKVSNLHKLSFIYTITGQAEQLRQVTQLAKKNNDHALRLQNDIVLGDMDDLAAAFMETGLASLGYLAQKSLGNDEEAGSILENSGQVPPSPSVASGASLVAFEPLHEMKTEWPLKYPISELLSPRLAQQTAAIHPHDPMVGDYETKSHRVEYSHDRDEEATAPTQLAVSALYPPPELEAANWGIDDEEIKLDLGSPKTGSDKEETTADDAARFPAVGRPASEHYAIASAVPFNHAAAGFLEASMQLLSRQAGIVDFMPLKPSFMRTCQGSAFYVSPAEPNAPLAYPLADNWDEQDPRKRTPLALFTASTLEKEIAKAYQLTTTGKFAEAASAFRKALLEAPLSTAASAGEVDAIMQDIAFCREYLLGLQMELGRRELAEDDSSRKRALELACYFTHCQLRSDHSILALRSALTLAYKQQNLATAGRLARRLLELGPSEATANQARKILALAERTPTDAVAIEYDDLVPFSICAATWSPIYRGSPLSTCPFCKASYTGDGYNGSLCKVCTVASVGASASGLQFMDQ